jgi:enoyl-[acyl-carrier protein] reductase II
MKNVQQRMNCNILGRARAKRGMFEGDLIEGELEIGQIAGLIQEVNQQKESF